MEFREGYFDAKLNELSEDGTRLKQGLPRKQEPEGGIH
jgi:hypothetical protein